MKLGVLLVHGIGAEHPEWAREIIPKVEEAALSETRKLLRRGEPPSSVSDLLEIESVYWAGELNERQQILEDRLKQAQEQLPFTLWTWLSFIWIWRLLVRRLRRTEMEFVSRSMADIIGYLDEAVERSVHGQMGQALDRLAARTGAEDAAKMPLTIVSHSLGTVISSDYIYDQGKRRRMEGKVGFHEKTRLENFFTVGSPLALFSLKYGGPDAFQNPISVEGPRGRWVNIRDTNDPIGMPLKTLNEAYGKVVLKDARVHAGPYLVSHQRYFRGTGTLKIIGRKLALDWAALNKKLPQEQAKRLYARYDEKLR
jgi:hypothetical protein